MTSRFKDHILPPDVHANRPAVTAVPPGTLFPCTTHSTIDRTDGTTWTTWASLGGIETLPASILTAKGDMIAATGSAAPVRLPVGTDGQAIVADSTQAAGVKWGTVASGGGVTVETVDAAIAAVLTGIVHRWKFDDASGATVADAVGSLPLTLSGTYTRAIAAPGGLGTTFGATAKAVSSGLGSIPVGSADRCILVIYRSTSTAQQTLVSYGTNSTRAWFDLDILPNTANNMQAVAWADDLTGVPFPASGPEIKDATSGPDWHVAAIGYRNSNPTLFAYRDGTQQEKLLAGSLVTATGGNFQVGYPVASGTSQFAGDIAEVIVLNNWPAKSKLDRILAAAAGVAYLGIPAAIKDRRWTPASTSVTIDEFNDSTLDPAWTRVDGTGAASGNVTYTESADVLSVKQEGGDTAVCIHGLVRPLSGIGGPLSVGDGFVTQPTVSGLFVNFAMFGIVLADGNAFGSGNQVAGNAYLSTSGFNLDCRSFTSWNTNPATAGAAAAPYPFFGYQRLSLIAANTWRHDWSPDGVSWINGTATISNAMVPTYVGFLSSSWGTSTKSIVAYEFLRRVSGIT